MIFAPPLVFGSIEAGQAAVGLTQAYLGSVYEAAVSGGEVHPGATAFLNLGVTLTTGQENPTRLEAHLNYKDNNE